MLDFDPVVEKLVDAVLVDDVEPGLSIEVGVKVEVVEDDVKVLDIVIELVVDPFVVNDESIGTVEVYPLMVEPVVLDDVTIIFVVVVHEEKIL